MTLGSWLFLPVAGVVLGLLVKGIFDRVRSLRDRGLLEGPHVWPRERVPITILPDEDLYVLPELLEAIENAIFFWNDSVKLELFVRLGDVGRGSPVPLIPMLDDDENPRTEVSWDEAGVVQRAVVYLPLAKLAGLTSQLTLDRVVAHELGHVLGLDHDEFIDSVMFGRANDFPATIVSPKDIELLRTLYGDEA